MSKQRYSENTLKVRDFVEKKMTRPMTVREIRKEAGIESDIHMALTTLKNEEKLTTDGKHRHPKYIPVRPTVKKKRKKTVKWKSSKTIKRKGKKSYKWSKVDESQDHKNLKQYIASNPECIGLSKTSHSTVEYLLPSADEIDVYFETEGEDIAVEVKSARSNNNDLKRGIFQCVKYRAILLALRQIQGDSPQVRAILVIERKLPKRLADIASTLEVRCEVVNPKK